MELIELPDRVFWGRFIDADDTDDGQRLRWVELRLYKFIDTNPEHNDSWRHDDVYRGMFGQELYLLCTVGRSLVYHAHESDCNKGITVRVRDMQQMTDEDPRDLSACPECRPPDWRDLGDEDRLDLEVPWYSFEAYRNAADLLAPLRRPPRCRDCHDGPHPGRTCRCGCRRYVESEPSLSMPGRRLLQKAALSEPDIAALLAEKTVL